MARSAGIVASRVRELLLAENVQVNGGLAGQIARLSLEAGVPEQRMGSGQVIVRNVSAEIAEKSAGVVYPSFHIYCEKLTNSLREKFRTFSGTARMVVEARGSQDRLEGLEERMHVYVDAITNMLDASRGDLQQGMFYTGGYEVTFGAAKHGGKNFLQTAKVVFEVEISTD